jgi:O-acetyl-ADP-ribose deacetylase (regulator of RNase III)
MPPPSDNLRRWLQPISLVLPLAALLWLADTTAGWTAVACWTAFFAGSAALFVWGFTLHAATRLPPDHTLEPEPTARPTPTAAPTMHLRILDGDLLDQDVDVLVNPWNRNVIPWWLLLPQGVSGAIKRRAGYAPFRELARHGPIPLGGAVLTTAGRLPHRAIIHTAGINLLWRASERSIRASVRNALRLARERGFRSIALPLIGAGTGGRGAERAEAWILDELRTIDFDGEVRVVRFRRG